jgi:hypothetical protein
MMESGIKREPAGMQYQEHDLRIACGFFFWIQFDCRLSIAFNPKGVAALSRPSILALKFITICPMAGCFAALPGKAFS